MVAQTRERASALSHSVHEAVAREAEGTQVSCEKMAYPTEASARRALRVVQKKGRQHHERRVYLCDRCRLFHLTKDPSDERRLERRERFERLSAREPEATFE